MDADTSNASAAKKRILIEFARLQEKGFCREANAEGRNNSDITVELVEGNPFLWRIMITRFKGNLQDDLINHAFVQGIKPPEASGNSGTPVILEAVFPSEFPSSPPFVRVVSPIFQEFTGRVAGGAPVSPIDVEGWDPSSGASTDIQAHLRVGSCPRPKGSYPSKRQAIDYISREPIPGTQTAEEAPEQRSIILSASFVTISSMVLEDSAAWSCWEMGVSSSMVQQGDHARVLYSTIDGMERNRRQGVLREGSGGNSVYVRGIDVEFLRWASAGSVGLQYLSPEPNQIIV